MKDGFTFTAEPKAQMRLRELSKIQIDEYTRCSRIRREEKPSRPLWGYELEVRTSGTGKESVVVGHETEGYETGFNRLYAEELDGVYILFDGNDIFGIGKTEFEADNRMMKRVTEIKKRYENDGFEVEFENLIPELADMF